MKLITGYTFVRVLPTKDRYVYANVKALEGVKDMILTYGKHDLIVKTESDSFEGLDDLIFNKLRMIDGVVSTTTLLEAKPETITERIRKF